MRIVCLLLMLLLMALVGLVVATSCPPGEVAMHQRGMGIDRRVPDRIDSEGDLEGIRSFAVAEVHVSTR